MSEMISASADVQKAHGPGWRAAWRSSMGELKKLPVLVFCGVMGALAVILGVVGTVRLGPFIRIGVSGIPGIVVSYLFGPATGMLFGGAMDIVKYLVNPDGAFFPGFTVSAMATGLIMGFFLYKKKPVLWRIVLAEAVMRAVVNIGLNTLWLVLLYREGFLAILPARITSNLIQLPCDTVILLMLLAALEKTVRPQFAGWGTPAGGAGPRAGQGRA